MVSRPPLCEVARREAMRATRRRDRLSGYHGITAAVWAAHSLQSWGGSADPPLMFRPAQLIEVVTVAELLLEV
jgi:hypothetical protein